jgi:hypothetical protein
MATAAFKGSKSKLKLGTGSPATYSDVFEVVSFGEFGARSDLIEATHWESAAKEYIGGLPDGMEVTVQVNYKPGEASHEALRLAQKDGLARPFQLILPPDTADSARYDFDGIVLQQTFGPVTPNEVVHGNFSIKITGDIVGPVLTP